MLGSSPAASSCSTTASSAASIPISTTGAGGVVLMASAPRRRPILRHRQSARAECIANRAGGRTRGAICQGAAAGPPCTAIWKAQCCRMRSSPPWSRPPEQAAPSTDALAPDIPTTAPQDRHEVAYNDGLGCHGERLAVQAHLEQLHMSRQVQGLAADHQAATQLGGIRQRHGMPATESDLVRAKAIDRAIEQKGQEIGLMWDHVFEQSGKCRGLVARLAAERQRLVSKPRMSVASSIRSGTDVTSICRALDQDRRKRRLKPTATLRCRPLRLGQDRHGFGP